MTGILVEDMKTKNFKIIITRKLEGGQIKLHGVASFGDKREKALIFIPNLEGIFGLREKLWWDDDPEARGYYRDSFDVYFDTGKQAQKFLNKLKKHLLRLEAHYNQLQNEYEALK